MGRKINPNLKIQQIGIGFRRDQVEFLENHPDFSVHELCRNALDSQIKLIEGENAETKFNE